MSENKVSIHAPDERGVIHIAEEVIASIAALAATEVEGVSSLVAGSGVDFTDLLGKKQLSKGVKLAVEDNVVAADVSVLVKYGFAVNSVAQNVQQSVKAALENMAGLQTSAVNVHVAGITFEKK